MKWNELTQEQRNVVVDYNIDGEHLREAARLLEEDFREALKAGQDAVYLTHAQMVEWWNATDEEDQKAILEEGETTGA